MFRKPWLEKRLTAVIAVASLSIFAQAGCGGGGGNDNSSSTPTNSPFAGSYIGTFNTTNPQSGTLNVTVATNGTLTGSGHNNTVGQDETISGTITNVGAVNVTFTYPTFSASASGTVAVASNGHLAGTFTQSGGGSVTIDLVKQ